MGPPPSHGGWPGTGDTGAAWVLPHLLGGLAMALAHIAQGLSVPGFDLFRLIQAPSKYRHLQYSSPVNTCCAWGAGPGLSGAEGAPLVSLSERPPRLRVAALHSGHGDGSISCLRTAKPPQMCPDASRGHTPLQDDCG